MLHGEDDGLVPASASEILGTVPLVERRTYPGLRHELHNEPEGPAVIDEIIAWLARANVRSVRLLPTCTIGRQPNTASGERLVR